MICWEMNGIRITKKSIDNIIAFLAIVVTVAFKDHTLLCRAIQIVFYGVTIINIVQKGKLKGNYLVCWYALLALYMFLSVIWAGSKESVIQYTISFVQVALLAWSINENIETQEDISRFVNYFILGATALAIRTLFLNPVATWGQGRIGFEGYHENGIANVLTYSSIMLFDRIMSGRKQTGKLWDAALLLLEIFVIILSAAKKNIIVLPVSLLFVFIAHQENPMKLVKNILIIGCVIAVTVHIASNNSEIFAYTIRRVTKFFEGTESGSLDKSSADRLYLMTTAVSVFLDHPLLGVGLHNFAQYNDKGLYAHNNYLELAASLGLIGVLLFYSIYVVMFIRVWHRRNRMQRKEWILFAGMIGTVLMIDLMQVSYYLEYLHIILPVMWSMSLSGDKKESY